MFIASGVRANRCHRYRALTCPQDECRTGVITSQNSRRNAKSSVARDRGKSRRIHPSKSLRNVCTGYADLFIVRVDQEISVSSTDFLYPEAIGPWPRQVNWRIETIDNWCRTRGVGADHADRW